MSKSRAAFSVERSFHTGGYKSPSFCSMAPRPLEPFLRGAVQVPEEGSLSVLRERRHSVPGRWTRSPGFVRLRQASRLDAV